MIIKYLNIKFQQPDRKVVWIYDIKVPANKKDSLVSYLNSIGIAARHSFKPMSLQYPFNKTPGIKSLKYSNIICYLPAGEDITTKEAKRIALLVNDYLT